MSARVTAYVAEGCHLCEAALDVLERVRAESPFSLRVIDIAGDPGLESRYRARIPVVEVDGQEAFEYHVHADVLLRRLAGGG